MSEKPPKLKNLESRITKAKAMGGEKLIAKQHESGKLTARERIEKLFDPGTFEKATGETTQAAKRVCRERS